MSGKRNRQLARLLRKMRSVSMRSLAATSRERASFARCHRRKGGERADGGLGRRGIGGLNSSESAAPRPALSRIFASTNQTFSDLRLKS
jgi:hypothetical protein